MLLLEFACMTICGAAVLVIGEWIHREDRRG